MSGPIHLRLIFVCLAFFAQSSYGFTAFDTPRELWRQIAAPPSEASFLQASSYASQKDLAAVHFKDRNRMKSRQLQRVMDKLLAPQRVSYNDMERLVRFLKATEKRTKTALRHRKSLYIHPGDGQIIKYPVQIYKDGTIYIHLRELDPKGKKGGYKAFSRSIDYDSLKVYASLVSDIRNNKDAQVIIDELTKMYELRKLKTVIGFREVDSYVSLSKTKQWQYKIAFQTELYEGDLGSFAGYLESTPQAMVQVAYHAAVALQSLHKQGFIHRDIKPGNFFLRKIFSHMELVLADLGLAHNNQLSSGLGFAGTRGFIAPEVCRARVEKRAACSTWSGAVKADIYSLGMAMLMLISNDYADLREKVYQLNLMALPKDERVITPQDMYAALADLQSYYTTSKPDNKAQLSGDKAIKEELLKIVWDMLTPDPQARLSLDEVVQRLTPLFKQCAS